MTHRKLTEPMSVYRIGDPGGAYPIFSGEGARRVAGRWHRRGQPVIYTAAHYSTAMLELLVHFSGAAPTGQHFVSVDLPAGVSYEVVTADVLPDWETSDQRVARAYGSAWLDEARSAILLVPSVVARMAQNVLINPAHPDANIIKPGLERPIWWDKRLFSEH
jgi:RES domain-containing protein